MLEESPDPAHVARRADRALVRAMEAHAAALSATRAVAGPAFGAMARLWAGALADGGKVMLFGNGGSAGDAQHLAAEMTGRLSRERAPLAGLALTTDTSALTAIGNDYGYEQVFARQVTALGRPGDVAVGISTSGTSPNVLAGLSAARAAGLATAGFTGADPGPMAALCEVTLSVPAADTARAQEMHILLGHALIHAVEDALNAIPAG